MRQFLRALLLLLLPLAAFADVHTPTGRWIVGHHLDATELSASPAALKRYEGKTLVVSTDSIAFAGESCQVEKTYQIATDDEARDFFLHQYKADYAVLKLVAPIFVIETDCNIVIGDSRNRVVFDWDGDFFDARPLKAKKHR